jgi:hypothetical protein
MGRDRPDCGAGHRWIELECRKDARDLQGRRARSSPRGDQLPTDVQLQICGAKDRSSAALHIDLASDALTNMDRTVALDALASDQEDTTLTTQSVSGPGPAVRPAVAEPFRRCHIGGAAEHVDHRGLYHLLPVQGRGEAVDYGSSPRTRDGTSNYRKLGEVEIISRTPARIRTATLARGWWFVPALTPCANGGLERPRPSRRVTARKARP